MKTKHAHFSVHSSILLLLWFVTQTLHAQTAPSVVVTTVKKQELTELVPVSGTVSTPKVSQLSTGVAGLVEEVLVEGGDAVEKGALLLKLDPALASWSLKATQAATEQSKEELTDAQRRLNDVKQLRKNRAIAETELKNRQSEVRLDIATLKLRQAQQEQQQERLNRHTLEAPFAGVITKKHTEAGAWVDAGDAVLELLAVEGLRIDLQIPQGYFPRINKSTPLEVRLDALGDRSVSASIGEIIPVSDPNARTFLIRAYPQQANLALTPGMSASAILHLKTDTQSLVVSRDALLRHPDGRISAWVVKAKGDDNQVEERQIKIGLAFNGLVEIRSGLDLGDKVVVEGNEALKAGQSVKLHGNR
ncbi:MAG: efflux RND transporter periplasmic adaptor subunit [Motiliproteus sp.]|nr:efflux RND transporter periplasmic adaptor subunit [Motiliproteus sp.]MCW9053834.1 efflux RND transporter periplasmic adaptor subunit [Motiliproteus sp.]